MTNEAITLATLLPMGPVHINVPLREPLYMESSPIHWDPKPNAILPISPIKTVLPKGFIEEAATYSKIWIIAGMQFPVEENKRSIGAAISRLIKKGAVFIPDITSHFRHIQNALTLADWILPFASSTKDNAPLLLITFGGPIVSKNIKNFLRAQPNLAHWHIGIGAKQPDTFRRLNCIIQAPIADVLNTIALAISPSRYANQWLQLQEKFALQAEGSLQGLPFSEPWAIYQILQLLPPEVVLHLGNSLPIRYVSAFPFMRSDIEVFSNRGTSGIDGCVSAAAGHSMSDNKLHVLICGDLSFVYDSHGLWNKYLKGNLKIIVLNNHGGGIFRQIPGPAKQPELEEYFVAHQAVSLQFATHQFGATYLYCHNADDFETIWKQFISPSNRPAVLELEFDLSISIEDIRRQITME